MIREARRICGKPLSSSEGGGGGMDVIALTQTPVADALVFKLEDDALGELLWEEERVLVGRKRSLALLKHLQKAVCYRAYHRPPGVPSQR